MASSSSTLGHSVETSLFHLRLILDGISPFDTSFIGVYRALRRVLFATFTTVSRAKGRTSGWIFYEAYGGLGNGPWIRKVMDRSRRDGEGAFTSDATAIDNSSTGTSRSRERTAPSNSPPHLPFARPHRSRFELVMTAYSISAAYTSSHLPRNTHVRIELRPLPRSGIRLFYLRL